MSNASNSPFSFAINPYTALGERVYFGSTPATGEARAERESTASSGGAAGAAGADDDPWEPPPPLPGIYSVIQRLIGAAEPLPVPQIQRPPPVPQNPPVPPVPRATLQCPECQQHFGPASLIIHIMAFHPLLFAAWSNFSSDAASSVAATESSFLAIAGRRTRPRWGDEEGEEGAGDGAGYGAGDDGEENGEGGEDEAEADETRGGADAVGGYNGYSEYTPYNGYEWRRISDDTAWVQSAIGSAVSGVAGVAGVAGGIGYALASGAYDEDGGYDGYNGYDEEGGYDEDTEDTEVEPTYEEYVALCDRIGKHEVGISNIDAVAPRVSEASDLAARCTICLESMADLTNLRKITRCRHEFCDPCLRRWFIGNHTCPICKDDSRGTAGNGGTAGSGGSAGAGGSAGNGGSAGSDSGTPDSWDTLD